MQGRPGSPPPIQLDRPYRPVNQRATVPGRFRRSSRIALRMRMIRMRYQCAQCPIGCPRMWVPGCNLRSGGGGYRNAAAIQLRGWSLKDGDSRRHRLDRGSSHCARIEAVRCWRRCQASNGRNPALIPWSGPRRPTRSLPKPTAEQLRIRSTNSTDYRWPLRVPSDPALGLIVAVQNWPTRYAVRFRSAQLRVHLH
jgi:hypothetical protein